MFNTRLNRLKKVLNTQSQIVEEDSYEFNVFNSSNSLLKHNIFDSKSEKNEEEMKDSQETTYENSHTSTRETNHQITSSFTKIHRQSRHKQSHRRFILESQSATQQAIITKEETVKLFLKLIDRNVNSSISLMMKNIDEFKINVTERSTNWMQSIFMLFDEMNLVKNLRQKTQQEQIEINIQLKKQKRQNIAQAQKIFDLQFRVSQIETQLLFSKNVVNDLIHQEMKIVKVKRCRNQHRIRKNELTKKMKILRMNKATLEKKILNFINKQSHNANFIDDFDQKDTRKISRRQEFERNSAVIELLIRNSLRKLVILSQKRIFERSDESTFSKKLSLMIRFSHEHKIKYQDILNFYENHDEWKQWKSHLRIKFESDFWQFFTKKSKIHYAKNHCKDLTWDIIEHRVDYDSAYSYEFIDELISDLKNLCENFDKVDNVYNELFDDKFFMRFKNKNEIFEQYLNRFNNLMTSLNLIETLKINQLFRTIIKRLINVVNHLSKCKNYHKFVREIRTITHQKKILNDIDRHFEFKITKNFKIKITDTIFRAIKNRVTNTFFNTRVIKNKVAEYNLSRLSSHIVIKLKAEEKCYKCFKFDHRINEQDVSCKEQKTNFREKVIIELTKLELKWNKVKTNDRYLLKDEFVESTENDQKN